MHILYLYTACFISCIFNVIFIHGHVTLTYPPARKFSLDGTIAQKSGCGWEKGLGPKTTFLAGSMINITWQSSLSHKGGFKLEMLDPLERPLMDLTPVVRGEKYLTLDSRVQNYEVRLPKDFECTECTIRLLQRASEWDENLTFVSCADVDVTRSGGENCLARGLVIGDSSSSCVCNKPYEGHRCQNENECLHDGDCGINGHCVDIGGLSYPKKQCFCNVGWFGAHCEKESVLKTKNINYDLYNKQELLPDVHLYWRLYLQSGEIEMFIVAKTTSYVALGWRPSNITAECKTKSLTNNDQRKSKQLTNEISTVTESTSSSTTTTFSTTDSTPSKKFQRVRFPSRKPQQSPTSTTPTSSTTPTTTTTLTTTTTTPTTTTTTPTTTTTTPTTTTTTPPPLKETISFSMESSSSSIETFSTSPITNPIISKSVSTSVEMSQSSSESVSSMSEEHLVGSSAGTDPVTLPPTTISKEISHVTVTDVQIKSYTPDGDRKKRDADSKTPIVPLSVLHPMDCVDMVVGSAKGEWGRVRDYYSRDQSTPQPDGFWDGTDDLTSAIAFEANGVTTVGFRRKLLGSGMTDHEINDQAMSLIWARGQDIEDQFYMTDEFKYHGGDRRQRGMSTVQFFQEVSKEVIENKEVTIITEPKETTITIQEKPTFYGEWKRPITCSIDNCEYRVTWTFDPNTDDIAFTVFTKHRNSWTGIGFSKDRFMNNTDAVIGWVNDDGRYFMMDMWINGYAAPLLDGVQNIDNQSGVRNESGTTLMFSRKRDTGDELMDLKFEDDECLYMIFPYNGGYYNPVNKKLKKHESTPAVSSEKICIRSQSIVYTIPVSELPTITTEMTTTSPETTTSNSQTPPKSPAYVTIFRIPIEEPLQRTLESNSDSVLMALEEKIRVDMTATLQNSSGFEGVEVVKLERDSNTSDWLIATMHVLVDKSVEGNPNGGAVKKAIAQSIATGSIGNLNIDKNFLIVEVPKELELDDVPPPVISRVKSDIDGHLVAIYAVIAAVCALGILLFIQIICSITRRRNARQTRISKEQLITNSGWKDYSTNTSANYNYEPFMSVDGEAVNPRKKKPFPDEARPPKNGVTKTSLSKQGPNPYQHPGNSRRSESLPRFTGPNHPQSNALGSTNAYATHQRGQRESGGVSPARFGRDLQPDFYFMPSQRRYTGDVIRVSVDYNNPNYTGSK